MKPLQGQLDLFGANDLDNPQNVPTARYAAHRGIVGAGPAYRGFAGETEAEARASFRLRFGRDPQEIITGLGGILLAGPIPSEGQP